MFDTLQDRLAATFKSLRGKGRITEADIDATAREIRRALLEADVALAVVKDFIDAVRERSRSAELSGALNPGQQIIKIVNEELVNILGGETRVIRFAKKPPTVILLAGLQGAGKTTLAGKLAHWLKGQGHCRSWWRRTCSGRTRSTSSRWSVSGPGSRSSRRSRAMGSGIPWRWPGSRWPRPSASCTTS